MVKRLKSSCDIEINKKVWKKFSDKQLDEYRKIVFSHYRTVGFPYYGTDMDYRTSEFNKFMRSDTSTIYSGDTVRQTMAGLALCWSYQPHSFCVK